MVFSRDPAKLMNDIKKSYDLKGVGVPEYYLGGDYHTLPDIVTNYEQESKEVGNKKKEKCLSETWLQEGIRTAFSAQTYIEQCTKRQEDMCGGEFTSSYKTPMAVDYHPELDESPPLGEVDHAKFRSLVGCANWLVTLGRFDIAYAVNAYSRHTMAPRQGHYNGIKRVFGYLKKFKNLFAMHEISSHEMYKCI